MNTYRFRMLLVVYSAAAFLPLLAPLNWGTVPAVVENALLETLAKEPKEFGYLLRSVYYVYLTTTISGLVALFFLRAWGLWLFVTGLLALLFGNFLVPWTYDTAWDAFRSEIFWLLSGVVIYVTLQFKKSNNFLEPTP